MMLQAASLARRRCNGETPQSSRSRVKPNRVLAPVTGSGRRHAKTTQWTRAMRKNRALPDGAANGHVRPIADGVDGAPNGIKRAKMVVVASAIWKGAVRGQVYHRYLVCHTRRA